MNTFKTKKVARNKPKKQFVFPAIPWYVSYLTVGLTVGIISFAATFVSLAHNTKQSSHVALQSATSNQSCFLESHECLIAIDLLGKEKLQQAMETSVTLQLTTATAQKMANLCLDESSIEEDREATVTLITNGMFLVDLLPIKNQSLPRISCLVQHQSQKNLKLLAVRENILTW
ncbi:MAG: hypothetical protein Tsb0014_03090 [Pleurocapsa sp.]